MSVITSENKNRPVRIIMESKEIRGDMLKKGVLLKETTDFNTYYIVPDKTPKQQYEDKKLRDKLREIRNNGQREARINKGKIIKNENGREVILFSPILAH